MGVFVMFLRSWMVISLASLLAATCGCSETDDAPVEAITRPAQLQDQAKPSPWQIIDGAARIALASEIDDSELADAIAQAKSSAEEARKRWQNATNQQRNQWAIKWAAPTVDGNIEHVWVKPIVTWSKFRIEGKLANQPLAELVCDKTLGQSVSFPIEELSDWVYLIEGNDDESKPTREGGFTIKLLEQRYGEPG